jgi:hypothetical protein
MKLSITIILLFSWGLTFGQFDGGEGSGYASASKTAQVSIYKGGESDGYASGVNYQFFTWTGAVGTGWNVAANWNFNQVPNIKRKVLIPNNALNFPFINAGLFSIGKINAPSNYFCEALQINEGAQMTLRLNAFLENRGKFNIEGRFTILNNSPEALINTEGGMLRIGPNGIMWFE